jgi:hypothetical protein
LPCPVLSCPVLSCPTNTNKHRNWSTAQKERERRGEEKEEEEEEARKRREGRPGRQAGRHVGVTFFFVCPKKTFISITRGPHKNTVTWVTVGNYRSIYPRIQ